MIPGVVGLGATGLHVVRRLLDTGDGPVLVTDPDGRRERLALGLSSRVVVGAPQSADLVVLACPAAGQHSLVASLLDAEVDVVSAGDALELVEHLLAMHDRARDAGRRLVVGAGFAPGLAELLAVHAADRLDAVSLISVAVAGTGGPACARQHHRALKYPGSEYWDHQWQHRRGGSGRELVWFPDPIGARDCYHAELSSPMLLQRVLPDAPRISARRSANRRDRSTSRLPMLRPPHPDGGPGAIRVEVRGRRDDAVETIVYGVRHHPSEAAAMVAAEFLQWLSNESSSVPSGAFGAAEAGPVLPRLQSLHAQGLRALTYESDGARME